MALALIALSALAGPGEDRRRRRDAWHRQRAFGRSGPQGLALCVVPLGEVQKTTPSERVGSLGKGSNPLRKTSIELLLHDALHDITVPT